jgi:SdrD B-like domain/Putative Ig domain
VVGGSLPAWASLDINTGQITGTPDTNASSTFTIRALDNFSCPSTRTYSISPGCSVVTLTPGVLPLAVTGQAYSQPLLATGGSAPYSNWSIINGVLPPGLTLNAANGLISGVPTHTLGGLASFSVQVADSLGCLSTQTFNMRYCAAISLFDGDVSIPLGIPSTRTLVATGGTAPFVYTLVSGSLPNGVSLNTSTGVFSGTASAVGTSALVLSVTDANGCSGTVPVNLTVVGMSIGNFVWQDTNNNGVREEAETPLAGAVVQLMNPGSDGVIGGAVADVQVGAAIVTDGTGQYRFNHLNEGQYYVRVVPPTGFNRSSGMPNTVDNEIDNNNDGAQPGGPGSPALSYIITLSPGTESVIDGDADPNTNLTVDFGFYATLGVGNVVFLDQNADGNYDDSEGVDGVLVQIFAENQNPNTGEPVTATLTDHKGRYFIDGLNPGTYFLHIPATQFQSGGALFETTPIATTIFGDDDVGQDLLATASPQTTGASTDTFVLTPAALPAGLDESGFEGGMDNVLVDANNDLTRDLGLVSAIPPPPPPLLTVAREASAYQQWQQSFSQLEEDQDLYPLLMEYALGTDPADGRSGAGHFFIQQNTATGAIQAVLQRPALMERPDLRYQVETSQDLAVWTPLTVQPLLLRQEQQQDAVTYLLPEAVRLFVRLVVTLDEDQDGFSEATATGPVQAYSREIFHAGQRTFSMPLQQAELYAGVSMTIAESIITLPVALDLKPGVPTYLEDLTTGQSYDIDLSASSGQQIALKTPPVNLTVQNRIAIRHHHTLAQLFPSAAFQSAADVAQADQVLTFVPELAAYQTHALGSTGWQTEGGDSAQALPLAHGQACLVQTQQPVTLLYLGQLASATPLLPTTAGTHLLSSGSALSLSPQQLGLIPEAGLRASVQADQASRLRLWNADLGIPAMGYQLYQLFPAQDSSGSAQWLEQTTQLLPSIQLDPFRGYFLIP